MSTFSFIVVSPSFHTTVTPDGRTFDIVQESVVVVPILTSLLVSSTSEMDEES